jgi:RNA polymerase sigma factor (TIGR02999 family)
MDQGADITILLQAWDRGEPGARDALFPAVYQQLKRMAQHHLASQSPGHTLQPTALINELYLRLAGREIPSMRARAQFFALTSTMMRQILVDHARARAAGKRGGGLKFESLNEEFHYGQENAADLLALDDALCRLEKLDPRKAKCLELRFFSGLEIAEIAEALGVSAPTVGRDLRLALAWLRRELSAVNPTQP